MRSLIFILDLMSVAIKWNYIPVVASCGYPSLARSHPTRSHKLLECNRISKRLQINFVWLAAKYITELFKVINGDNSGGRNKHNAELTPHRAPAEIRSFFFYIYWKINITQQTFDSANMTNVSGWLWDRCLVIRRCVFGAGLHCFKSL